VVCECAIDRVGPCVLRVWGSSCVVGGIYEYLGLWVQRVFVCFPLCVLVCPLCKLACASLRVFDCVPVCRGVSVKVCVPPCVCCTCVRVCSVRLCLPWVNASSRCSFPLALSDYLLVGFRVCAAVRLRGWWVV
jgi:hypothetical protein